MGTRINLTKAAHWLKRQFDQKFDQKTFDQNKFQVAKGLRRLRWATFIGIGLSIALILKFPLAAAAQATQTARISNPPPTEIRGVWLTNVDSDVLFSRDNLRRAMQRLERLNFNTVYPTVWQSGYTLYPSEVAEAATGIKVDPEPGLEDRDMLAEAIEFGHNRGLSVIPWFEFGLMAPADSELVKRHPEWVTSRRDGSQVFNMHGEDRSVWLNPAHPEVQELLVDLVTEVVEKYDIDGIQFDDHFGTPTELGYDDYTKRLYQRETSRTPPTNPRDTEWMRWRAGKVSDLMIKIYSAVKTRKPDCLVSLSPNPRDFAYQNFLQDWYSWQRLGFLDELIVQVYRTDLNRFLSELDRPELRRVRERIPVGIGILAGLSIRPVQTQSIIDQVRVTRDRRFAGVSFFFYETLGDRDGSLQSLFPNPAMRPGRA
jgi:uncharacterized lipoprotein YddW (UPF0748 family)